MSNTVKLFGKLIYIKEEVPVKKDVNIDLVKKEPPQAVLPIVQTSLPLNPRQMQDLKDMVNSYLTSQTSARKNITHSVSSKGLPRTSSHEAKSKKPLKKDPNRKFQKLKKELMIERCGKFKLA
jgi:hypothetical protein